MSSFDRRRFLLAAVPAGALALAGCGFTPVYGPQGGGRAIQGAVRVDAPEGREGYLLTRTLEERLGRGGKSRYGLSHAVETRERGAAIATGNVTTRYTLLGEATYALRDLDDGRVLLSGKVDSFTSYSASGSTVATTAAREDARERLMTILADQIVDRLLLAAPDLPE
ncbi:LPS assembly lipoprotein LptE [Roseovarius salinarum]|uniref:LPS assembly lipoprotein LptE n=1 Tax=Roseovarius salinarum TaxID=1981892 RepID=UPI000C31E894|nr:LPS assembly lipoprotein LptE [Roseovarius salinarum]